MEVLPQINNSGFIESNTIPVSSDYLEQETIIPSFAKDNESTISHTEFIEAVFNATQMAFNGEEIGNPTIKVSHPIKGRIPEAKGKPVKELLDHERTLYYERMMFMIEIPSVRAEFGDTSLSLSVGGVRAYNHENLYNTKSPEKFKVFIGFKNWACTNLCVSTDGYLGSLKVQTTDELFKRSGTLFQDYQIEEGIGKLQEMQKMQVTQNQFSHIIGRAKQCLNMGKDEKAVIDEFPLGESQLSAMVREYYQSAYHNQELISLWQFYNLMTSANKSSYIDSFTDRSVACLSLCQSLGKSLSEGTNHWYL